MTTSKKTLLLCGLILLIAPKASSQQWRKIVPMRSTRADVEKLLGTNKKSYGVDYELTDGVLSIEYSSGPCNKERKQGWNVPEDVVISFTFSAKNKQRESDLKLKRKQFRRVVDTHTRGIVYYINRRNGIMYEVQHGEVESVEYFPSRRYDHLYCGDSPDKEIGFH